MDAHRELTEDAADKALRELFRETGHERAAYDLEARVLERIAIAAPVRVEPELIPKWIWIAAGVLTLGLAAYLFAVPSSAAPVSTYFDALPSFSLPAIASSPWVLMAVASVGALLALDAWLGRKRLALSRH